MTFDGVWRCPWPNNNNCSSTVALFFCSSYPIDLSLGLVYATHTTKGVRQLLLELFYLLMLFSFLVGHGRRTMGKMLQQGGENICCRVVSVQCSVCFVCGVVKCGGGVEGKRKEKKAKMGKVGCGRH
ncbi:MAG: hypothetical protein J3R72DRAFT_434905, partial [Linnemannia gamsii]